MAIENPKFGKGITLAGGFDLGAKAPLDSRDTVATIEERDAHVAGNRAYEGMLVFVEENKKTYQYVNNAWVEFGFNSEKLQAEIVDGLESDEATKILSAKQGKALKGLIDAEAERAAGAEEDLADAIDAVEGDLADLAELVGVLPEGTTAKDVVDYVNIKTAGIATDAALGELNNQVSGLQTTVQGIKDDYLKAADKTELSGLITAEKERAEGIEGGLRTDVDAIKGDYLKGEHKTALEGAIALKADQTALDAVSGVANAAVKQSDYDTKVKALEDEDARIAGLVSAEAERAAGVEADLDERLEEVEAFFKLAEGESLDTALDTLVEIQSYLDGEGKVADQMLLDIAANKKAIEDHAALDHDFAAADATLKSELEGKIDLKADKTTVEGIDGRVTTAEGKITTLEGKMTTVEGAVATKAEQADLTAVDGRVTALEGKVDVDKVSEAISAAIAAQDFSGFTTDAEHEELAGRMDDAEDAIEALEALFEGDNSVDNKIAAAKQAAIDAAALDATGKADAAEAAAKSHADGLNTAMDTRVAGLEAASATHALASDLTALDGRVTAEEGKVSTLQGEMSTAKTNIANIQTALGTHSEQIASKAAQSELDAAEERLADVEELANTNKSGLDTLGGRVGTVEGKLAGIAEGAQVNVIETIKVNGEALEVTGKAVDIAVPTGALAGKDKVAEGDLEEALATKLNAKAENSALEGAIERIADLEANDETQDGLLAGLRTDVDLKATQADHELLAGRVTDAEGEIDALQGAMTTKVETSVVEALDDRVETLEGTITTKANDADLAAIAKTGSVADLVQPEDLILVFDCGGAEVPVEEPAE